MTNLGMVGQAFLEKVHHENVEQTTDVEDNVAILKNAW